MGMVPCPGAPAATPKALVISQGRAPAIEAPSPMKRLCMAKPRVCCSCGSRSATKARKGSMLTLMEASRIQSRPAAIQRTEELGIRTRASELRMAPVRK